MQANKKTATRAIWSVSLLLAVLLPIIGWLLSGRSSDWFKWERQDPTLQALELIRTRYVDQLSTDSLKGLSLDSMMSRLDPHSAYLPPSMVRTATDELAGHFAGIGIEFGSVRDTIAVMRVMPGSPSEQAGLMIGDRLLAIDDRSLTDSTITLDSILVIVRGPVGSIANLTIKRKDLVKRVSISRSNIPTPAVTAQYMLNDTTGYIKLSRFASGSYRETVMALEKLKEKGMRALVLDLRSNGGGFLNEAVELADEFLSDDRLIVYTEGAHLKRRSYSCKRPGLFEQGKLFVLMNELSASASEVLAGSLQDWCRATIIGRRSYGKGLVQEQYELSNGGALRLTVARYFTPLGRCIQRPYLRGKEIDLTDSLELPPSASSQTAGGCYRCVSPCGDTLYAGGGIRPDVQVPKSVLRVGISVQQIMSRSEIILWAYDYYQINKKEIDTISDMTKWAEKISIESIRSILTPTLRDFGFKSEEFSADDWNSIGSEVFAHIARFRFGPAEYIRFQNTIDPFLQITRSIL